MWRGPLVALASCGLCASTPVSGALRVCSLLVSFVHLWSSLVPGRASKSLSDDARQVGKWRLRAHEGAEGSCSGKLLLPSRTSAPALCSRRRARRCSRCARSSESCNWPSMKRCAASEAHNAAAKSMYKRSSSRRNAATSCSSTRRASVSETFSSPGRMIHGTFRATQSQSCDPATGIGRFQRRSPASGKSSW